MRLKFEKGRQKELILAFKKSKGFTWNEVFDYLDVPGGRFKPYIYEKCLIPESIYNLIDLGSDFDKYIVERKEEGWGRVKGGIISKGRLKKINYPQNSKELAEFYGVMLGDGNSFYLKSYKKGVFMIRIVGDFILDKDYHLDYLKPLMNGLFGVEIKEGKFKNANARFLQIHSRELVEFLKKKGFKPGNKIKNKLRIPNWIKEDKNYLISCLRGLYDTDGSVYKLTNQNSHQICFTNSNFELLEDVRSSLIKLGINCSKISKKDVYITKKSELKRFLKLVGFSNHRHLCRLEMFGLK